MADYLHIVCFTAPSPPDYGGAFDLYYKIPELAKLGKKIILHYFDYKQGRGHQGLEPYCVEINRYDRKAFFRCLFTLQPYIVSSRLNRELIHRLNLDHHPVLLEGIHCTGIIPYLVNRKIVVRVHNDEAVYYKQLQQQESSIFKWIYFFCEALLLALYQKELSREPIFVFVSETDKELFRTKYQQQKQIFLPCFLPWQQINSLTGKGDYCLYHGNLSISENRRAAFWLAENIFKKINFPLVIAGKNANTLRSQLSANSNVCLIDNPSDEQLAGIIRNAHINILPSFNNTGVKLKLLHALFEGRFCITNAAGLKGSGLHSGMHIANDEAAMMRIVNQLLTTEFSEGDVTHRNQLKLIYNNNTNAATLNELL